MRPLSRPMFRYGGPIKEGGMSGIREPKRNGGSMTQRVQPSTDGSRPGYAGPATPIIFVGMGLNALRHGAMRLGSRYIMPMLRRQVGTKMGPGSVKVPGQVGTKGRFLPENVKIIQKQGPSLPKYEPTWLGRAPLVQGIGWAGKSIFNPTTGGWAAKGLRMGTSPSTLLIGGLYYANGRWFNKDGSPANKEDIAAAKATQD